jgi:hypothetical protein
LLEPNVTNFCAMSWIFFSKVFVLSQSWKLYKVYAVCPFNCMNLHLETPGEIQQEAMDFGRWNWSVSVSRSYGGITVSNSYVLFIDVAWQGIPCISCWQLVIHLFHIFLCLSLC